jgi:hypothetical protein
VAGRVHPLVDQKHLAGKAGDQLLHSPEKSTKNPPKNEKKKFF